MPNDQFPILPGEEDDLFAGGAATEMTGLIPTGRPGKDERDSFQDVLPYLPPFGGNPAPAI